VRPLRRRAEDDRPIADGELLSQLGLWARQHVGRCADAVRDDVDARGRDVEVLHEIVGGALGHSDHARRAFHAQRNQHRHAQRDQAEVRLGMDLVDQVVDGDDATESTVAGPGCRQAVDQLDALALREARQVELLAAHPADSTGGVHRHGHRLTELEPRLARGVRSFAADERGHLDLGRHLVQPADQLSGIRFHPAGVSGHEEDEIQAEPHR
jgi:hypothetical protein